MIQKHKNECCPPPSVASVRGWQLEPEMFSRDLRRALRDLD